MFQKGNKVNLGRKSKKKGIPKIERTQVRISKQTRIKLKQMKKLFRNINKKQFNNYDDVVNHIINLANKYAHGIK
ncbi:MAG: hypothetical protein WC758_07670 [Candidatus Woesearchaeota archaeon]|jgi:hypothetical protein